MSQNKVVKKDTAILAYIVMAGLLILMFMSYGDASYLGGIIISDFVRMLLIINIISSGVIGLIGRNRRIGFGGAFFLSLLASPVVGLIATLISPTREDEAYKERMMELTEQGTQTQQVSSSNTADQLYKLNELRKDGVLTQEEFDSEKAKILAAS